MGRYTDGKNWYDCREFEGMLFAVTPDERIAKVEVKGETEVEVEVLEGDSFYDPETGTVKHCVDVYIDEPGRVETAIVLLISVSERRILDFLLLTGYLSRRYTDGKDWYDCVGYEGMLFAVTPDERIAKVKVLKEDKSVEKVEVEVLSGDSYYDPEAGMVKHWVDVYIDDPGREETAMVLVISVSKRCILDFSLMCRS